MEGKRERQLRWAGQLSVSRAQQVCQASAARPAQGCGLLCRRSPDRSLHAVPSLCLLATWLPSFLETEHFLFPFYLQK